MTFSTAFSKENQTRSTGGLGFHFSVHFSIRFGYMPVIRQMCNVIPSDP